jgi:hypothetical protein
MEVKEGMRRAREHIKPDHDHRYLLFRETHSPPSVRWRDLPSDDIEPFELLEIWPIQLNFPDFSDLSECPENRLTASHSAFTSWVFPSPSSTSRPNP